MEIKAVRQPLEKVETELLAVTVFEDHAKDSKLDGSLKSLDEALKGKIQRMVDSEEIKGKYKEFTLLHTDGIGPKRVLIMGMGKEKDLSLDKVRSIAAVSSRNARRINVNEMAIHDFTHHQMDVEENSRAIAEGIVLGLYRFDKYKSKKKGEARAIHHLQIVSQNEDFIPLIQKGAEKGVILAETSNFVRDLVNEPACYMTPTRFSEIAKQVAKEQGIKIRILDDKDIAKEGMGAFKAVTFASDEPSKLVVLEYQGDKNAKTIGLVGKGVMFDSGGYDLKPADAMFRMYSDMAGAAATLGAMQAIAKRQLPINVVAVLPLAENLVNGRGYKPGDILHSMSGKTIEVLNTDAEGRLLLADSLTYIQKHYKLDAVADIATLTGAVIIALGRFISGVMSNNSDLIARISHAGEISSERVWELPAYDDYRSQLVSDVADIENVGGRSAGSITAAVFLKEFIENDLPWLHIDIAGTAMMEEEIMRYVKSPYHPKEGATGTGARMLYHFVESFVEM